MAKASEVSAAELLSRFFDEIRAAEQTPPASQGQDEATRWCPAQDGTTQPSPAVGLQSGPEQDTRRQQQQKLAGGAAPTQRHGEDSSSGSTSGTAPAARRFVRGGADKLPQLRQGVLCRVGGKASPLWTTSRVQACGKAGDEPLAFALPHDEPARRRLGREDAAAAALPGGSLEDILQDVEQWLREGEQAALQPPFKGLAAAGPVAAGGPAPAGFPDRSGPPPRLGGAEKGWIHFNDAHSRQLQEEAASTAHRQAARRRGGAPGGEGDDDEGAGPAGAGARGAPRPRRCVLGGPLLPMEMKPMLTCIHGMSYLTAMQFSIFHSWHSHFGLMGPDAEEGEDPRVRGLVSSTTPAILLCELNAVASFNMMDPILSYNYEYLMEAARLMHKRTPHGQGMPGRQPLGYVVQGAGPHLCPGGNHHPVSPPGGTPASMHINSSSNPFIYNRECNLPSMTPMTGSVIGGGVALSLQQTHRLAASSASMAFGNISRGACPVMFLSQNLPACVGLLGAVEIYLTDGTYSACKGQRCGMVHTVLPSFVAVKTQAMKMVRKMAAVPALRLVNDVRPLATYSQYQREAMGMTLAMRTGRLFANVKSARWSAPAAAEQGGVAADGERPAAAPQPKTLASCGSARPSAPGRPASAAAPAVEVLAADEACAQCGQRGVAGVQHGEAIYCATCWPLLGAGAPTAAAPPRAPQKAPEAACAECRGRAAGALQGEDGLWYCGRCWQRWRAKDGAEAPTDVGTDHTDADSGSEDTVIGSDCVTCSDVWSESED